MKENFILTLTETGRGGKNRKSLRLNWNKVR